MKRHFYTLLLATALAMPAAGAFASGMSDPSGTLTTGDIKSAIDRTASDMLSGEQAEKSGDAGMHKDAAMGSEAKSEIESDIKSEMSMEKDQAHSPEMKAETDKEMHKDMDKRAEAAVPETPLQKKLRADNDQILTPQELSNAEVRDVQSVLENHGYYKARIDGLWGPKTARALQSFQSDYALQRTGQLDAPTVNRLSMAMEEAGQPRPPGQMQDRLQNTMEGTMDDRAR